MKIHQHAIADAPTIFVRQDDKGPRELSEAIDLILARAPALIAAGVTSVSTPGFSITLAPPPPPAAVVPPPPPAKVFTDPLSDPSTFPGGRVPGFRREGES